MIKFTPWTTFKVLHLSCHLVHILVAFTKWQWKKGWWEELQAARPLDMQNVSLQQQQQQQLALTVLASLHWHNHQLQTWLCLTMQLPCVVFHPHELVALVSPAFPRGWRLMRASWGEANVKKGERRSSSCQQSTRGAPEQSEHRRGGWGTYATINTLLTALTFKFKAPHSARIKSNSGVTGEIFYYFFAAERLSNKNNVLRRRRRRSSWRSWAEFDVWL